jgi:hypothetical protein
MLSQHLAELYEVKPRTLNQAVKRNIERFPEDFMFQLTEEEDALLRSQTVTLKTGRGQHSKYLPYAFTEQGVAMLSSVLHSERAIQVNIEIMRTFVRLRQMLAGNAELARKLVALEKKYDAHTNPENPLEPSFPRKRESSKTNSPRSGQSFDIGPLRRDFLINWIPAYAGMTSSEANGLFGFKTVFEAIHELMSPPKNKKKRPIGFAPWDNQPLGERRLLA